MKGTAKEPIKHNWAEEDYKDYRREIVRDSQGRRRQKAREAGLCPICCLRLPPKGKKTCAACRERIANRAWEKRHGFKKV